MSKISMKKLFPESLKNSKGAMFITAFTLMVAFVVATVFSSTTNEQASKKEDVKTTASNSDDYANRFAGEAVQTVASKKYKTTAALNLRTGASTKYKRITTLKKGATVTYLSKKGSWYRVSAGGKKGYVSSKYLKRTTTKKVSAKSSRTMYVTSTAYTAYCAGCSGRTATGINLRKYPNKKVIAVDPLVIPLGSKVHVQGYGTAIAGDTGGAIRGKRIDVFQKSKKAAINWGRRTVKVTVY